MNMFEELDRDGQYLAEMLYAPARAKLCLTAIEMDVFSHLVAPKSAGELAKELSWHTGNTGYFLDALTGIRLLQKDDGSYRNTEIAAIYLVRGGARYMGDFMLMYAGLDGFEQCDLAALVREGPAAAKKEPAGNVSFADRVAIMRSGQTGERTYEAVRLLKSLPEFAGAKKLLDLGCGAGMLGIAEAKENPRMEVVLFDTPQMEPGIRETIGLSGAGNRVTAMCGDYLGDDIGSGYDIILAFATLNFAKPVLGDVMKKLHAALTPNGVLLVSGDGIHSGGTQPAEMVVGWLPYTMMGMDFRMMSGAIPGAALAAGFRSVHTTELHSCSGMTEINVIRK
jgi:hypothetical protein